MAAFENWSPDGVPTSEDEAEFNNNFYPILPKVHLDGGSQVAKELNLAFQPTQGE